MRTSLALLVALLLPAGAFAQCPASVPVEGAPPPGPLPLFPADNWWNADATTVKGGGSVSGTVTLTAPSPEDSPHEIARGSSTRLVALRQNATWPPSCSSATTLIFGPRGPA